MNSFGNCYRLTSFGESHGPAVGGIIDGVPAGFSIDLGQVQAELDRRRPGQSSITTPRDEKDRVKFLSGLLDGVTTGTPIGFEVENSNQHSDDYENLRHTYRPSHADFTYDVKYGVRDHRGGGRASARETIARVVGGAVARQILSSMGVTIYAYTSRVGELELYPEYLRYDPALIETNAVRCPDPDMASRMIQLIERVKQAGDTIGGVITGVIKGLPAGIGEPVFDKLQARLAGAMLSINAAKGFDYGMGFAGCGHLGSEVVDRFVTDPLTGATTTATNHSGGIQGGISNGRDIFFRVAFKPVATLLREIETVTDSGEPVILHARGRHDPCVLPRAVPVVEAMAAMTILDLILINRTRRY